MAVKTFTTGEVLTAADTNTYLANGGLVYISGASFTNVTTYDITGFTSTYKQFRVIFQHNRDSGTGASVVTATFRDATTPYTTGYYGCGVQANYLAAVTAVGSRNNGADMYLGGVYDSTSTSRGHFEVGGMNQTVYRPNITGYMYDEPPSANVTFGYEYAGARTVTIDRIRVACAVGITGTWRLYGYREP